MDEMDVVRRLRDIAAIPQTRARIARDEGYLPGLVIFLKSDNKDVVQASLEALRYLSMEPSNRSIMRKESGLVPSLKRIVESYGSMTSIHQLASGTLELICNEDGSATAYVPSRVRFIPEVNKKAQVFVLSVDGLVDTTARKVCEERILTVKGVISFTFDLTKHRCVIRSKPIVKAGMLCQAINQVEGLHACQVVKSESGEETFVNFDDDSSLQNIKTGEHNDQEPDYLPEDEVSTENSKSVAVTDSKSQGGGWLSGVTGFISRSLYW